MKKPSHFLAAAAIALSVAVLAVPLSACSKKTSAQSVSGTQSAPQGQQNMEIRIQSGLAELVSAGTITQAQADKIKSALTERMGSGSRRSGSGSGADGSGSRPDFSKGDASGAPGSGRPSGTPSDASGGSSRRQGGNFGSELLSSLVSNGTITQEQANAVIQKLFSFGENRQQDQSAASSQS